MQPNPHIKISSAAIDGDDIVHGRRVGPVCHLHSRLRRRDSHSPNQMFESGVVLSYDDEHYHDHYGWRYPNPVLYRTAVTVAITSKEFHQAG